MRRTPSRTPRRLLAILCCIPAVCGCGRVANGPPAGNHTTSNPIFRDTAPEAGLRFAWGHGGKSPLNILETAGGGAGFIDYDGDGLLDIVLVGSRIALYHNEGNGHFRDVSAGSGLNASGDLMGCAVGDYDNDGRPDLFLTGHGITRLYRNVTGGAGEQGSKGAGESGGRRDSAQNPQSAIRNPQFEDVTSRAGVGAAGPYDWSTSAGFADLDGDGFLDLAVCHYVQFTPQSRQLCDYSGAGGAKVWAACPPFFYPPERLTVYRNRRDGTFEDVSSRFPDGHGNNLGLAFADYDGDGRMDLYVANDGQPGDLYHNEGAWRFTNVGAASATAYNQDGREQAGMGADWGDYDGDGRLDLVVATFQDEPKSLYHNDAPGPFTYASYTAGIGDVGRTRLAFGAAFIDVDNDGWPDLLFSDGHVQDTVASIHAPAAYPQPMLLFRNHRGAFTEATREGGPALMQPIVGRALAVGDFDNDGRMDALVMNLEGAPLLLHNESPPRDHWIGVRAVSRFGKRDAIGVRVTVETATRKHVAEAQTCRSYLAACDPRVHVGLGDESAIVRLTIRWPNGRTTSVDHPQIDRYLSVEERP